MGHRRLTKLITIKIDTLIIIMIIVSMMIKMPEHAIIVMLIIS